MLSDNQGENSSVRMRTWCRCRASDRGVAPTGGMAPAKHDPDGGSCQSGDPDGPDRPIRTLCAHYGMTPTRNNRGVAHENGAIESTTGISRGPLTTLSCFVVRGILTISTTIAGLSTRLVGRRNRRNAKRLEVERPSLRPLPARRTTEHEEQRVTVTSHSGFTLRKPFYMVAVAPDWPPSACPPLR